MIYCPECGTANRDGSRFCNECGQRLGAFTRVKCPACGSMNPVQHAFCSECGGRLLPGAAEMEGADEGPKIKGLSLPTGSPATGEEEQAAAEKAVDPEDEGPAWLRELGARWHEESRALTGNTSDDSEDMPDWLRDLRDTLPDAQEVDSPEESGAPEGQVTIGPATGANENNEEVPLAEAEDNGVSNWLSELQDAAGAETEETEELPGAEEGEGPDWPTEPQDVAGAETAVDEVPEEEELPEAEEGEVRDRPAELGDAAGAEVPEDEAPEEEETPEAEVGEIPDWLAELRDAAGAEAVEDEVPQKASPEAGEGEIPDWLAELHDAAGAKITEDEVPEEEIIPEQPAEISPRGIEAPEAARPEPMVPVAAGEEGEGPRQIVETESPEEAETDKEGSGWAADLETGEPEPAAAPEVEPADRPTEMLLSAGTEAQEDRALEPEDAGPPDWLVEQIGRPEEDEQESWEPRIPDEEEALPAAAVPGWMADVQSPAEPPSTASQVEDDTEVPAWLVPAEEDRDDILARAEIPDWLLDLKPAELREEGEPPEFEPVDHEPVEETGILAGLHGVLPVEMIIAQPRSVSEMEMLEAPVASDAPQVRLFGEIVGRPPGAEPQELAQPQPQQRLGFLSRSLIFIALIAVVTLPLLVAEPLWPRNMAASIPVQNLYEEVERLDESSLVLVAFDYDPSTSDEMNIVGQVLIDHVMAQGAGIAAVSLYPAGPPVAQAVLDELAEQHPDYTDAYGQHYVNLGYLPGQATAVRLLGQSFSSALPEDLQNTQLTDLPLVANVSSLQDFSLIIELAASEQSVRWWVEQAAAPYNVPLAGGVSASVVPLARPYYQTESQQLVGLVGGLPDAAAYATLRGAPEAQEGTLAARLDSLTGGHLVFILVLAVGSAIQFLRGNRGGR